MAASVVLPWRHKFIETNHIRLHCVTQGTGDLVILLHGFLEFWYSWQNQIPSLARSYRVVAPDLRGYNDSDKPGHGYDLDTLGRDIQGLIQSLGYEKATIVGHGWGGTIAWHLAQTMPERVRSLVLISAPHPQRLTQAFLENFEQLQQSWYILAAQVPALPEWLLQANLAQFLKALFHSQSIRKAAFSQADTDLYQAALSKPGVLTAAMSYYRQLLSVGQLWRSWSLPEPRITVPTLMLWGEEDRIFSYTLAQDMERWVRAPFRLQLVPHCGHWSHREAPQTVNREVLQFLRQYPSP